MLLSNKALSNHILKYNGTIAIWGRSNSTRDFFSHNPKVKKIINYIIDSNELIQNQVFENKTIVSLEKALENDNLLIIVLGNHVPNIISELNIKGFKNYLINYEYSNKYFPHDLVIELDYYAHIQYHKFCDFLIDFCVKNEIEFHVKPFRYRYWPKDKTKEEVLEEIMLFNKSLPKNTLSFTYHTVGNANSQYFRWKDGYLYNTITFDKKGFSGWSSLAEQSDIYKKNKIKNKKVESFFKKLKVTHVDKNLSKYEQLFESKIKLPKEFIFFPLQTTNDTVILQSYFNPIELFKKVVKILNKKNIALVVKRHPLCENEELNTLLTKYSKQKRIILFNGSIHEAIAKASSVYVINSGVGFEALMHLKPVVTFGKSDYMHITRNIKNLEEIESEPLYVLSKKDIEKIKQFLYYYVNEKSIDLSNKKDIRNKIQTFIINYVNKKYYGK